MHIFGDEEVQAVERVLRSGYLFRYTSGQPSESDLFEKEWRERLGCRHALAMSSGTAALISGLVGLHVGPGDEVVVPAYTFIATALAPLAVGAIPVLAEIDESLTIDPGHLQQVITPRTKAVIPVHMCGLPCDLDAISRIASQNDILLLEDCCQAAGGHYRSTPLGTIGQAGAFSFNQFKIITCGEGGALVTNDSDVFQRALVYHDTGCVFRDNESLQNLPSFAGVNFRITDILTAILRVQLQRLPKILRSLRREKAVFREELSSVPDLRLNPSHDQDGDCGTVFPILFETPQQAARVLNSLNEHGVPAVSPINSERHVYSNWEPVLSKRGAHHPLLDPFQLVAITPDYSRDMCPRTLSILARTIYLETSATRSESDLLSLIRRVKQLLR